MEERWLPVPEYEGAYEVSDRGRVRSLARAWLQAGRGGNFHVHAKRGRILRPGTMNKYGHVSVALGKGCSRCVHELVALAFIGVRPEGQDVAHLDGDGSNNNLRNLSYKSRTGNNFDISVHDRRKISRATVESIIKLSDRVSGADTARIFGVSQTHVSAILNGTARQHG